MSAVVFKSEKTKVLLTRMLCAFVVLGLAFVIALRLKIAASSPLWLDETWSAMIATQPDWAGFWRETWLDCHPPLYYFTLKLWIAVAGDSNFMLRLPSIIFTFLAALVPRVWRPSGLTRCGAWTFAALLLLWQPSFNVMLDARGYALLLLLSTCSCIAFLNLLDELTRRNAVIWVMLGTMMFLTHYYSGAILAGQTLILIYCKRLELLRLWPTAFLTAPGLAWFGYHLPRLADYARPDVSVYPAINGWSVIRGLTYIFGIEGAIQLGILIAFVVLFILRRSRGNASESHRQSYLESRNIFIVLSVLVLGFSLIIAINIFKPSLTDRYFVPLVPSAMLALALMAQRIGGTGLAGALLALSWLVPQLDVRVIHDKDDARIVYNSEEGSDFIRQHKPDRLLFVWDHPLAKIMEPRTLEQLGGYFLKRDGSEIPVQAILVSPSSDANALLRSAAIGGRPAIIWLYSRAGNSAAVAHPPSFENDPAWQCFDRRSRPAGGLSTVACVKNGPVND